MKSKFHPEALAEFDEAVDFYDAESEGLGQRFKKEIESCIRKIEKWPRRWPIYDEEVRRTVADVFPFVILYMEFDAYLFVVAVMHTRRDPDYWKVRLN